MLSRGSDGESFWAAAVPEAKYADSVILAASHGYTTLAHEATHVLRNSGDHYQVNPATPSQLDRVNLIVDGNRAAETGLVIDSRRLTLGQEAELYANRPNLVSTPV